MSDTMSPTVSIQLLPHGVYVATSPMVGGGYINFSVRCDPLECVYVAYRVLAKKFRRRFGSIAYGRGRWDRPTYRLPYREDSRWWYLAEDDIFFHWKGSDYTPPAGSHRLRRRTA